MSGEHGAGPKHDRLTELAVKAARGGDKEFEEFWNDRELQEILDKRCGRIVLSRKRWGDDSGYLVAELKQAACIQAKEAIQNFRGEASVVTWLNIMLDHRQLRNSERETKRPRVEDLGGSHLLRSLPTQDPEITASFNEAVEALTTEEYQVYALKMNGYDAKAIARKLYEARRSKPGEDKAPWHSLCAKRQTAEQQRVYRVLKKISEKLKAALL